MNNSLAKVHMEVTVKPMPCSFPRNRSFPVASHLAFSIPLKGMVQMK